MNLQSKEYSTEEIYRSKEYFLRDSGMLAISNSYQDDFSLTELFRWIDIRYKIDKDFFTEDGKTGYLVNESIIFQLKSILEKIYEDPTGLWFKILEELREYSAHLEITEIMEKTNTPEELINNPNFINKIAEARAKLPHGILLNVCDILPLPQLKMYDNGLFIRSTSQSKIRRMFGYWRPKVKSLEDIGFTLSEEEYVNYFIKNTITGKNYLSRTYRYIPQHRVSYGLKLKTGKVFQVFQKENIFRLVTGIDVAKHALAIANFNESTLLKMKLSHAIPHKPHKRQKNAQLFIDENGNETTLLEYSIKHGISKQGAYKRLLKLNNKENLK